MVAMMLQLNSRDILAHLGGPVEIEARLGAGIGCGYDVGRGGGGSFLLGLGFEQGSVYDDTEEGSKVCTYYKLESIPVVLVLDPITGQKMHSWRGMIQPETTVVGSIFVGGGKVVHFTRVEPSKIKEPYGPTTECPIFPDCGFRQTNSNVVLSCLDCFLRNGSLYSFEYGVRPSLFIAKVRGGTCTTAQPDPPDTVTYRAMYLLQNGFGSYDIFQNNCEDFALYCKTGLLTVGSSGGWEERAGFVGRSGPVGGPSSVPAEIANAEPSQGGDGDRGSVLREQVHDKYWCSDGRCQGEAVLEGLFSRLYQVPLCPPPRGERSETGPVEILLQLCLTDARNIDYDPKSLSDRNSERASNQDFEGSGRLKKLLAKSDMNDSDIASDFEALSDIFESELETENEVKEEKTLYMDVFEKIPTDSDGEGDDFEEHLRQISTNSRKEKFDTDVEMEDLDEVDRMIL
ncbi:zinc finger CCCH domain-containing protein 30 [Phtheirospermum japonicum]|uniref:Zinc finger CCCH domain-containing protein 30 n=1 Tax=Phtheirospermum japonicum TaxID=374723 RepID=A0A830CWF6_9LAMI|nr:zinc finger CCCH domain-containing protein 30 [Phtheirospermum japonicum]